MLVPRRRKEAAQQSHHTTSGISLLKLCKGGCVDLVLTRGEWIKNPENPSDVLNGGPLERIAKAALSLSCIFRLLLPTAFRGPSRRKEKEGERGLFGKCTFSGLDPSVLSPLGCRELCKKVVPRLRECCRQNQAEVVSNSRNKIHQTWVQPNSIALYCNDVHVQAVCVSLYNSASIDFN